MTPAESRLAVYGTLAPGRVNHHHVRDIRGRWLSGTVRGTLYPLAWGAARGYPGIILDPAGDVVEVHVLESDDLPGHWPRLDAFEGPGYDRVHVAVRTGGESITACIYALASDLGPPPPGHPTGAP